MKIDKPEISGLLVLFIGVGLLAFTFLNAYWLLSEDVSILASQDLVAAFGQALAPLIVTVIHIMYLGIMGWIGSLLTLRGIPLLTHPKTTITQPAQAPAQKPIPQTVEVKPVKKEEKPEAKSKEELQKEPEKKPETGITIEVRPPEETAVSPQKPAQPQQPQQTQQQPQN